MRLEKGINSIDICTHICMHTVIQRETDLCVHLVPLRV